jgi:hypothetical protein
VPEPVSLLMEFLEDVNMAMSILRLFGADSGSIGE